MSEHQSANVLEMLAHRTPGRLRLPLHDGPQKGGVTACAVGGYRFAEIDTVALAVDVPHHLLVQIHQGPISGAVHDRQMKLIVERVIVLGVSRLRGSIHVLLDTVDFAQHLRFAGLSHPCCGELFERNQHFHSLANLGLIRVGDHSADVRNETDQTFSLQRL